MRILDENNEEILEESVDKNLGYLIEDKILIAHHEATGFIPEKFHYELDEVLFDDDTVYIPEENDNHILVDEQNSWDFTYIPFENETRQVTGYNYHIVIDKELQLPKEAWDEYENILRYKLYTQEELEAIEKRKTTESFLETAPDRLTTAENSIGNLAVIVTDMFLSA